MVTKDEYTENILPFSGKQLFSLKRPVLNFTKMRPVDTNASKYV